MTKKSQQITYYKQDERLYFSNRQKRKLKSSVPKNNVLTFGWHSMWIWCRVYICMCAYNLELVMASTAKASWIQHSSNSFFFEGSYITIKRRRKRKNGKKEEMCERLLCRWCCAYLSRCCCLYLYTMWCACVGCWYLYEFFKFSYQHRSYLFLVFHFPFVFHISNCSFCYFNNAIFVFYFLLILLYIPI